MELKGAKINFLGDSITAGSCVTEEERFSDLMAARFGVISRNYGLGGTRIARQQKPSECEWFDLDFNQRMEDMDPDADVVVVFGGTNDFGHGDAPFGTFEDRDKSTFCGACHELMTKLINRFPESVIVFMTPLHRLSESSPRGDIKPEPVGMLEDYVNMIKKTAAYYGIAVLDLFSMSGLQPKVPIIQEKYVPDGLHPNDAGHVILAERVANFLEAL